MVGKKIDLADALNKQLNLYRDNIIKYDDAASLLRSKHELVDEDYGHMMSLSFAKYEALIKMRGLVDVYQSVAPETVNSQDIDLIEAELANSRAELVGYKSHSIYSYLSSVDEGDTEIDVPNQ